MIEYLAINVEQRAKPEIADAIPHHVCEARIGHRIDDLEAVDVGADKADRWHDGEIVAACTDHQLSGARAAEIHCLKEMNVTRDRHPHAGRHDGSKRQLLYRVF